MDPAHFIPSLIGLSTQSTLQGHEFKPVYQFLRALWKPPPNYALSQSVFSSLPSSYPKPCGKAPEFRVPLCQNKRGEKKTLNTISFTTLLPPQPIHQIQLGNPSYDPPGCSSAPSEVPLPVLLQPDGLLSPEAGLISPRSGHSRLWRVCLTAPVFLFWHFLSSNRVGIPCYNMYRKTLPSH